MVWDANAPSFVAQMRTQLIACASWTTAVGSGNESARVHYPSGNPSGDNATADPVPMIVIVQVRQDNKRYAEGARGLIGGSIELDLLVPAVVTASYPTVYTAGQLETLAQNLSADLMGQLTGIPFTGVDFGLSQDPAPAALAAHSDTNPQAFRTIRITLAFGYSA